MRRWLLSCTAAFVAVVSTIPAVAAAAPTITPAKQQWALDAEHFDAAALWKTTRGAGVTVAVVDSGVDPIPDLAGRLDTGIDEAAARPDGRTDASGESHGTSVAAVIAAGGSSDGTAVAGVAPQARILPVAIGDDTNASSVTVAQGIAYAATHGASVINVSLDLDVAEPALRAAVRLAVSRDAVVVASAGNDGAAVSRYPAALPGVLSVSGVDRAGTRWATGNRGPDVALLAPSTGIYTISRAGYELADGTTYAAAYVSGVAALLRSRYPHETAGQIIRRLTSTASRRTSGPGPGYGAVVPVAALAASPPSDRTNPLLHRPPRTSAPPPRTAGSSAWLWWVVPLAVVLLAATAFVLRRRRRTS